MLKDCKGNIDLFRLAIRSFTTTSCSLSVHGDSTNFLKDLSNKQPRGTYKPISHPTPRHKRFNLNTYHRLQSKHEVYLTEIPLRDDNIWRGKFSSMSFAQTRQKIASARNSYRQPNASKGCIKERINSTALISSLHY